MTILEALQKAGQKTKEEESEICVREAIWLEDEINEHAMKPTKEIKATLQSKTIKITTRTEIIPRSHTIHCKVSTQTFG